MLRPVGTPTAAEGHITVVFKKYKIKKFKLTGLNFFMLEAV